MRKSILALCASSLLAVPVSVQAEPFFETTNIFPAAPGNKPNYRIPSLIQVPNGDLLCFVEKRNSGIGDVGNHDLVLKRSTDKGKTWGSEQLIYDDGTNTSTDGTIVVDAEKGKIFLFFLKDKKKFAYLSSADWGATWQGPVVIHDQVIKPEWDRLGLKEGEEVDTSIDEESGKTSKTKQWKANWVQRYGVGPGAGGVQLTKGPHKGRLLVPARHKEQVGKRYIPTAHIIYSDDHGETWKLGSNIATYGSETELVELANGDVLASMRDENGEYLPSNLLQLFSTSSDGGTTWSPARRVPELITPRVHASIRRLTTTEDSDKNRLLFSNTAHPTRTKEHPYGRYNTAVRISYDEGETWSPGKTVYKETSSYGDLVVMDDGTIGLAYERGPEGSVKYWDEIQFARFNLEWLTDGKDKLPGKAAAQ